MGKKRRGISYRKRVADINRIYGEHSASGLSNREIWRRYIWPVFGISERTLYSMLKAPSRLSDRKRTLPSSREQWLFPDMIDDISNLEVDD